MANGKKKHKKHQSLHKAIKPFIKDRRVLYAMLGGLGAGVVMAAVMGPEKGGDLVNKVKAAIKDWEQQHAGTNKKGKLPKLPKPDKPKKPKKLFSKEPTKE